MSETNAADADSLEALITNFIDLKIEIDCQEDPSSELVLSQLDKIYAFQRQLKAAIQEKQRRLLQKIHKNETANGNGADDESDDSFPVNQLSNILADMNDTASQLDQLLVKKEAKNNNTPTSATAAAPAVDTAAPATNNNNTTASPTKREQHNATLPSPVPNKTDTATNPLLNKETPHSDWAGWGALEIDPGEIRFDEERDFLGKGSFGKVYAGRCRGKEVAVKVPVKQHLSEKDLAAFRHEVLIMSKIFHPNVVLFMGACTQPGTFRIVTELLHTDLERLLRSDTPLTLRARVKMVSDAALGMNWLHGISGIIHRDLKPANLLVDSNFTVKLTDFGFAQLRPEREDETLEDGRGGAKGTPLWMAPEIMMGRPFTEKVDIYSFGIILWQVLTRGEPFSHHRNLKLFRVAVCKRGERPPMPADAPPRLAALINACWDGEPAKRPSFKEIIAKLDDVLIDAVIDDADGAAFWRKNFAQRELQPSVAWPQFARVLLACVNDDTEALAKAQDGDDDAEEAAAEQLAYFEPLLAENETQTAKGDALVVTMQRFATNIKWFGKFFEAGAQSILDTIKELETKPWFHGDITKEEAEARLSCRTEGTFLVRLSATTPGCPYTISMINNQHRRVLHESPTALCYAKGSSHGYKNLVDLIENCKELSLVIACPKTVIAWGYKM